jgi:multiple sugar transport system permease protein
LEDDRVAFPSARSEKLRAAQNEPLASRRWFKRSQCLLGRDWPTAYLFIALTALLLGLVKGFPVLQAIWFSFHRVIAFRIGDFVFLDNYRALWGDERFVQSVQITLTFTCLSEVFKISLGLLAAVLLHNVPRWGSVLGGLLLVPYVIPEVVRALAWRLLLDPMFGAGNFILVNVLHLMSTSQPWLSDPRTALPSVILVSIWAGLPFIVVLLLAGLKGIDAELYDAASVDGANGWRRFLHITLPGLRDVLIIATLLSTIGTFNSFTLTYLLTSGGPVGATRVYSILAYEYGVSAQRTSTGIAVAMTAAPMLLGLTLILGRYMMRRDERYQGVRPQGPVARTARPILWPLTMALRGIAALLWVPNDAAERLVSAVWRLLTTWGRPIGLGGTPSRTTQRRIAGTIMYLLIGLILLFELLPVYFVVITAFKTELQIQQVRGMFWPDPWTLEQFGFLFTKIRFVEWYRNTVLTASTSTIIAVLAASMGAYGLVRLRWRGAGAMGSTILVANLMPGALMLIPMYLILAQLKVINTPWALLLTYPTFVLPFATWLLMGYYRSIPEELESAALIDGCNRLQAFFRVVLPLVRPALLAVGIFAFTQAWNEFLYACTFLRSEEILTLPVGLSRLIVGDNQPWGLLMAASLLTAVPVGIMYTVGQKLMISGLLAGSMKG